jgi:hypothetical protein
MKSDPGSSCEGRLKTNHEGDRFVHNPDFRSDGLFDITLSLIERIGAKARTAAPTRSAASDGSFSPATTGSRTSSRIDTFIPAVHPDRFMKILVVLADGRIETLTG